MLNADFIISSNPNIDFSAEITQEEHLDCNFDLIVAPPGEAATVEVGTTTTGAPGTDAEVTNVGTQHAAILDFLIPRGDRGATGVVVSDTEPTDPEVEIWLCPSGEAQLPLLFIDGGRADSMYTATQIIDGGNAQWQ